MEDSTNAEVLVIHDIRGFDSVEAHGLRNPGTSERVKFNERRKFRRIVVVDVEGNLELSQTSSELAEFICEEEVQTTKFKEITALCATLLAYANNRLYVPRFQRNIMTILQPSRSVKKASGWVR